MASLAATAAVMTSLDTKLQQHRVCRCHRFSMNSAASSSPLQQVSSTFFKKVALARSRSKSSAARKYTWSSSFHLRKGVVAEVLLFKKPASSSNLRGAICLGSKNYSNEKTSRTQVSDSSTTSEFIWRRCQNKFRFIVA